MSQTLNVDGPIKLDDQFLGHLREAAYDWGIEDIDKPQRTARKAAIWFGRCIVTLIDELRRLRAAHVPAPQGEQEPLHCTVVTYHHGDGYQTEHDVTLYRQPISASAPLPAPTAEPKE